MATRPSSYALSVVFLLAIAIRAAYVLELRGSPLFDVLLGDGVVYDAWARRIALGRGWGSASYYQTPVYAWFLAGVYRIAASVDAARWAQAFVGASSCALVAVASTRWFGRRVGLAAGLVLALYAPAIAYGAMIERAVLDVLGVSVLLALLAPDEPRSPMRCATVGLVLSLSSINRETMLCAYLVVVPWTLARTQCSRVRSCAALAGGSALVFVVASLQLRELNGEFRPFRGGLGLNLYMGNNPRADGLYVPLVEGHGNAIDEMRDATRIAQAERGRPLSRGEVSAFWRDEALAWMGSHPRDTAALFVRKLRYTLHDNEWSDSHGYAAYRGESTLLTGLGSVSRFGVLIALAAFGAAVAWPQRRNWWPVAVLAALLALATAVFFVFGRYRLVLVPLLVPLAAVACVDLASLPHFDRRRWIGCAAAVVLAASALGRTVVKDQSVSDTWVNAAGALCARDRAEQAREALEQVLALDTRRVDARIRLGHALACTSRWSEAEAEVQRALLLDASWRAPAAFELGLAAGRGGDLVRAAYWLQRAVDADDESPRAWERLGVALRGIGKLVQAERALRRAHELDPTDPDTLNNLGYLLEQSGRHGDAREAYDRALALDPDHAHARQNAARMHAP